MPELYAVNPTSESHALNISPKMRDFDYGRDHARLEFSAAYVVEHQDPRGSLGETLRALVAYREDKGTSRNGFSALLPNEAYAPSTWIAASAVYRISDRISIVIGEANE